MPLAAVLLVSQAVGLVILAALVVVRGEPAPALAALLPAAVAGVAGAAALGAFYRALAIGTMSIVAPISATGAALPVVVGLASGERPSALQLMGMAGAVIGVVLASREAGEATERVAAARRSVALALVAALGFGSFFVGMDAAAGADVLWALVVARGAAVVTIALATAALRPPARVSRPAMAPLVAIGLLDTSANALFALASTIGLLSLVAVVGSLYPVATVLLARAMLGERVRRVQEVGIVLALTGVALIAGG